MQLREAAGPASSGDGAQPLFERWYGEDEVFAPGNALQAPAALPLFQRSAPSGGLHAHVLPRGAQATDSAEAPVLAYSLYNAAAYGHLRGTGLHDRRQLEQLRRTGSADATIPGNRAVPEFPADSIVLKTAWWPIAADRVTPMPVWDPADNTARRGGNDYTRWSRVVAVEPRTSAAAPIDLQFVGRRYPAARRVPLDLPHLMLDAATAAHLARDPGARKLAALVLGRSLRAGDALALVGVHFATKEIRDWVWGTFWWHDEPERGPFAADRPDSVRGAWAHYLLDVSFDDATPRERDGSARITFNPWLEGRFPDGGRGGGLVSNCLACHRRAGYPAEDFLPVTRGAPDLAHDAAYAPGRLRTSFLWSIALRAAPPKSPQ